MPPTMTADSIAEAAQNLSLPELDAIMARLTTTRAHRRVPALSQTEADLLKRIEAAVPLAALQRRKALKATQAQRELTAEEHDEFAQLTDEIELAEAGRIDLLSELATLRGITLPEVARQLGLSSPSSLLRLISNS
jgi:hypothetical protein